MEDNDCRDNNRGFWIGENCINVVVRKNLSLSNTAAGVEGGYGLYFSNNIQHIATYNNTFDGNGNINANQAGNVNNGSGVGYANTGTLNSNVRFKNNIVSNCINNANGRDNARVVLCVNVSGISEWDYNTYYTDTGATPEQTDKYAVNYVNETFAQWQVTSSLDANSLVEDPELDGNGVPSGTSPVLNAAHRPTTVASQTGVNVTVADDVFFHEGDLVEINDEVAQIVSIATNVLTLSKEISAINGDAVDIYHPVDGKLANKGAK